ncbi:MAG: homocysteine S-methyltransferase [Acidobacteria bacterium]|nr:MAG: homocysteine S-methyltransferase [Acidobacteriota bacterium]
MKKAVSGTPRRRNDPLSEMIERQGRVILDGGLATALEERGHNLDDPLWSARLLIEEPGAITEVHLDSLQAGADCITTSSYQATLHGFSTRGLSKNEGRHLLRLSTDLALEARDSFWGHPANRSGRLHPLVAASIGPYGAFLADGSEYTGAYEINDAALYEFHQERWQVLAESPADLLACETLPSLREARVLLRLLKETPGRWAWLSFTCRDGFHLSDGSPFVDAVRACTSAPGVAGVGINCTAPRFVSSLIEQARDATDLPIIVYPNSGEVYDPTAKRWISEGPVGAWVDDAAQWSDLGATAIGGCCRIGPKTITELRLRLLPAT